MTANVQEQEQNIRMLRESAAAVANRTDLSRIRKLRYTHHGFERTAWQKMAELGWLGLRLPEERGGSGLGMAEYCALVEELGGGLVPEPLIAGVLTAHLLDGVELGAHLASTALFLPAWQEHRQSLAPGSEARFAGGVVNGCKCFVAAADGADGFVVQTDRGIVLVAADAPGLKRHADMLQDGTHMALLEFSNTPGRPIPGNMSDALEEATLATAAYLLGVVDATLERTLDYLRLRQQFGVPIGTFQALQHEAVDMKLQAALAHASIRSAAAAFDAGAGLVERQIAVSLAKARANEAALLVTRQAIQLHGGIGFSDEHDIGLFLRKAMVLAPAFGSTATHRRRYAALALNRPDRPGPATRDLEIVE